MSKSSLDFYFDLIANIPLLTHEQEICLIQKAQVGNKRARNKMVKHNLKLVVNIVKRRYHSTRLSMADLIAEGNFGLISAINKFDVTRGLRFNTYACYWIRQAIIRAIIDKGVTIRIPVYLYELQVKYFKFAEVFERENDRPPTKEETKRKLRIPTKTYEALQSSLISVTSIDKPVRPDKESEGVLYGDIGEETEIEEKIDFEHPSFKILNEREIDMVKLKYGFVNGNAYTLQEIAVKYKMSRERVRQLLQRSLKKLAKNKYLKEFYLK